MPDAKTYGASDAINTKGKNMLQDRTRWKAYYTCSVPPDVEERRPLLGYKHQQW